MSDLRDPELRDALRRASGDDCDTLDALVRVEARVRRIRRRRMDIAGLALLVTLVVTLGIASRPHPDESPSRPASIVTTASPAVYPPVATAAAAPVVTDPAPPDAAAPTDTAAPATATDAAAATPAAATVEPEAEGHQAPAIDPPPARTPPEGTQPTYGSHGGSLTVAVSSDSLRVPPTITNEDAGGASGDRDRRPNRNPSTTSGRTGSSGGPSTARPSRR